MAGFLNFTVETLLNQQIELIGPAAVSLDSLWRAGGHTVEQSPRRWMTIAGPLIASFERYFAEISAQSIDPSSPKAPRDVLWTWDGENSEPWRTGDVMAHELLARIYAAYLDATS